MNQRLVLAGLLAVMPLLGSNVYAEGHKYIGVNKCKICHMSDSKGNQYKHWLESAHAKAYESLASADAKNTAERVGLSTDPQKSAKCLRCHVTAFDLSDDLKEETFSITDGIQCETCHGAGSDYKGLSVMKDKQKSIEAGMIVPDKEVCLKCHNQESPNYKEFNYDEFYKRIAHPLPKE